MRLTPSHIPQIQQGGKAAGSERKARAAQCLVFSTLKVLGVVVGGRGGCYPEPTGARGCQD